MTTFKKITMLSFIIFFLLLIFTTCKHTTEPFPVAELTLTVEDVSCTEAWLMLKLTNISLPTEVTLYKNNSVAQNNILCYGDTLLYIDSLMPNQTYKFLAEVLLPAHMGHNATTNELTVTTLDTTSHNFTFQSWTFGELSAGASGLFDVTLIGDNNIYAVGRITSLDSLGNPDPNFYNAVHWNGSEWELKRITVNFRGSLITPQLEGVFAFSSTDIWFVGSLPIHGDGTNWTIYDLRTTVDPNLSLSRAWGSNTNDMYFVGRNGSIAHWNGRKWTRIESNIMNNIQGIYGSKNSNGEYEILTIASEELSNNPTTLIKIDTQSKNVKIITGHNLPEAMKDIWMRPGRKYIAVGNGIYSTKTLESKEGWKREVGTAINKWYTTAIDGEDYNDIVVCGSGGELLHYNGWGWENLTNRTGITGINRLAECKIRNGVIVGVGFTTSGQGIIILGKRS